MSEISVKQRYEMFLETIKLCGLFLLKSSDQKIEYNIFEEFDGDCVSFLHYTNLDILYASNMIDKRIYSMSLELSRKFRALEGTELWNVQSVKTDKKWLEILTLSDNIKRELRGA